MTQNTNEEFNPFQTENQNEASPENQLVSPTDQFSNEQILAIYGLFAAQIAPLLLGMNGAMSLMRDLRNKVLMLEASLGGLCALTNADPQSLATATQINLAARRGECVKKGLIKEISVELKALGSEIDQTDILRLTPVFRDGTTDPSREDVLVDMGKVPVDENVFALSRIGDTITIIEDGKAGAYRIEGSTVN